MTTDDKTMIKSNLKFAVTEVFDVNSFFSKLLNSVVSYNWANLSCKILC